MSAQDVPGMSYVEKTDQHWEYASHLSMLSIYYFPEHQTWLKYEGEREIDQAERKMIALQVGKLTNSTAPKATNKVIAGHVSTQGTILSLN